MTVEPSRGDISIGPSRPCFKYNSFRTGWHGCLLLRTLKKRRMCTPCFVSWLLPDTQRCKLRMHRKGSLPHSLKLSCVMLYPLKTPCMRKWSHFSVRYRCYMLTWLITENLDSSFVNLVLCFFLQTNTELFNSCLMQLSNEHKEALQTALST